MELEKKIENQIRNVFYDLDGIAIMGTSEYASVEDMEYIARHFYELGLNSQNNAPKIKGWVARDGVCNNNPVLFAEKPYRPSANEPELWHYDNGGCMYINSSLFPELKWEDDPIEVELTI